MRRDSRFFAMPGSRTSNNIQYREPADPGELKAVFGLRFDVYSEDALLHILLAPTIADDLSSYDVNALHFAAFDGEKAVGYIRMTTGTETHFSEQVKALLPAVAMHKELPSFPFQSYYPDEKWSRSFLESLQDRKIGEVGRLAIHPDYRGGDVFSGLITHFISYCKDEQGIQTGFGSCVRGLERYYRRFGFSVIAGSKPFQRKGLEQAVMVRFDR